MKKLVLSLALIATTLVSCTKNELGKAGDTVKELKTDFYTMTVNSDAGFEHFLNQGGACSTDELASYLENLLSPGPFGKLECEVKSGNFACSALHVENQQGAQMLGRNFDWDDCKAMVIRCYPKNAYASIATSNLDFLGFGEDYIPKGLINQYKATAAVYVPMDGINEKGVVIADLMAGDKELTDQKDASKKNLTTTTAIRLVLNYAANVDEALNLLEQYNIHSDIGSAHHFIIADAAGKSVAVEWVENKMIVTPSDVLNNHYLCSEKQGIGSGEESLAHEAKLLELRSASKGIMTADELTDAMFAVLSLPDASYYGGTQWTIIYNMEEASATYHWRRDRAEWFRFFAGKDITVHNSLSN